MEENPTQEPAVQATPEATATPAQSQEPTADVAEKLAALEKEREALRKELEKTRREAAERRVEKKTLEERLSELEQRWKSAEEAAKRADLRAKLSLHVGGDEKRIEAAIALAERLGVDDPVQLLEQFPFLRAQTAQAVPPMNPGQGARRLTASAIASMSAEEYSRRRGEILAAMARGEIAPE